MSASPEIILAPKPPSAAERRQAWRDGRRCVLIEAPDPDTAGTVRFASSYRPSMEDELPAGHTQASLPGAKVWRFPDWGSLNAWKGMRARLLKRDGLLPLSFTGEILDSHDACYTCERMPW